PMSSRPRHSISRCRIGCLHLRARCSNKCARQCWRGPAGASPAPKLIDMRIVLATHSFDGVGGSEVYLLTLAEQLLRLGHGVTIYAVILGKMAELARARAIDIAPEAEDLSEHSDVAITQDVGVSYELAARWPRTPQVFVCHSSLFDFQLPPLVP